MLILFANVQSFALICAANDIATSAYRPEGREILEILDSAEQKIFAIAEQDSTRSGPTDIKQLTQEALAKVYERYQSPQGVTALKPVLLI